MINNLNRGLELPDGSVGALGSSHPKTTFRARHDRAGIRTASYRASVTIQYTLLAYIALTRHKHGRSAELP